MKGITAILATGHILAALGGFGIAWLGGVDWLLPVLSAVVMCFLASTPGILMAILHISDNWDWYRK
jgi:hypothetical protein